MPETVPITTLVGLAWSGQARELAGDIAAAAARAAKADPGDRSDVVRYERLCTQLEFLAWDSAADEVPRISCELAPGPAMPVAAVDVADPLGPGLLARLDEDSAETARRWLAEGRLVVSVTVPFQPGVPIEAPAAATAPPVAQRWRAPDGVEGARAVEARFRAQLAAAVSGSGESIRPSGVHNRVLTNVLREYVEGEPANRVDAPVAYRDGSTASHPFPLCCLRLTDAPTYADVELRLALLSIRHTEMDPVVDGAWLRNAEVSRPRPSSQTDDFVYDTSLRQLDELTGSGRRSVSLHIYQTGLDTAVVGFYRAVTAHLLAHPGSLTVVPMFAAVPPAGSAESTRFRPGRAWSTGGRP